MKKNTSHTQKKKCETIHVEELLKDKSKDSRQISAQEIQKLARGLHACQIELKAEKEKLHKAQRELETTQNKYQDLYENTTNAYFSVKVHDGSIRECNGVILELLGYDKETMIHQKFFDICADTPHGLPVAQGIFDRLKKGKSIKDSELQMKCRDTQPIWVNLSVYPVRDQRRNVYEGRFVVVDISQHKWVDGELKRRNRELSSLNIISTTVSQSLELSKVLIDTLHTVIALMNLKAGWIFLREEEMNTMTLTAHVGLSPEFAQEEKEKPLDDCVCLQVVKQKRPLVAVNILKCPRLSKTVIKKEGLKCHASVPLVSKDSVVGVMNVASEHFRSFSSEDLDLLTSIGHQVGVAIENAKLFEETRRKSRELEESYIKLKTLYEELKEEKQKTKTLSQTLEKRFGLENIIGKNHRMQAIYDLIENVAPTDSTVLIQGESGTG
ncbi:MAG: GAF domain-containing protein, partial [Thermodesulfobacteriota bacterium]|nr:GAF domain-containing protein [Thermodesulfobacteriota bacterium]